MTLSKNARVAGLLYLLASLLGNAAVTANNIAGHESLFRFGMVSYLLCGALWSFVTLPLFRLLKGVNQTLAVLMAILGSFRVV